MGRKLGRGAFGDVFIAKCHAPPQNIVAMNNIAYLLADRLGRPEDALPFAQQSVQLRPNNHELLDTLGWVFYKLGQYDQAESQFGLSLSIRESSSSLVHLAAVLLQKGEFNNASNRLDRAERLRHDSETQAEINRLKDDIERKRVQEEQ